MLYYHLEQFINPFITAGWPDTGPKLILMNGKLTGNDT